MGTFKSTQDTQTPRDRRWIVHLIISAAFALAIGTYLLAPVLAWQWTRNPFLGVFLEPTLIVSDVHNPAWPARQAGLRNADRVLAIDGQPVATARDVADVLRHKQPGQLVALTAEKDPARQANRAAPESDQPLTSIVELEIPPITFPLGDFIGAFVFPYLLGLLYLVLGIAVYRVRRYERSGQVFAFFTISFAIFAGSFLTCMATTYWHFSGRYPSP